MPLTRVCLGLVLRDDDGRRQVLLGRKRYGFGAGKIVAPGGHVEAGETPSQAVVRELFEETGLRLDPDALTEVADVTFRFPAAPAWDLATSVFLADAADGDPRPSDEIEPCWVPVDALPFADMWDDARYWLARALAGERFAATFTFADDNETVAASRIVTRT